MWTRLHWIEGPWPGKLAVSARPRGGDWLNDEVASWKSSGIGAVLSLLTPEEETDLDIQGEARTVRSQGIEYFAFPIPDRQIPSSDSLFLRRLEELTTTLSAGKNLLVHCRQGIGRSGLVAAGLLVTAGLSPGAAVEMVSAARGAPVPETAEQREWIDRYAASLSGARMSR